MSYRFDTRGALLPKVLGFIMLLFIGILITCYLIAREANPIILDEHGHVRGSHSSSH